MKESSDKQKQRAARIYSILDALYPGAETALVHKNAYELVVATLLSAQCTDERVNKVTPALFEKAPNPTALAELKQSEIEKLIGSVNYFKTKAKNLKALGVRLSGYFRSVVPDNLEDLQSLPGVGRKTANVVLANAFNKPALVVDTHVGRLARRMAFTNQLAPEKVERDLSKIFKTDQWGTLSHLFILHGRAVCKARSPDCVHCKVATLCPKKL